MSNGSAVRSGIGAISVGAMSATVSSLTLILVAVAIYRLPLPDTGLVMAQGMKVVAGGMMGAFIVAGLAFVAPKLGPTQTFILYFFVIALVSALIDGFGLLGHGSQALGSSTAYRRGARGYGPGARPLLTRKPAPVPRKPLPLDFG
jgi:uncharacterized membrane protein YdcZ (DUF606 family)